MESNRFATTLLRSSASGFAAIAVSRVIERSGPSEGPGAAAEGRFAAAEGRFKGGFDAWQAHVRVLVLELAAAVDVGRPEQFAAKVAWTREAFAARELGKQQLCAVLEELSSVLSEALPESAWSPLAECFAAANRELERPSSSSAPPSSSEGPHGELVQAYLSALRLGEGRRALEVVGEAVGAGRLSVSDALEHVLSPALRELGGLWHAGQLNIAEEHFATQTTGRLLERLMLAAPEPEPSGHSVVLAMVEGDAHDLGLRIVAAYFELAGWRTVCLGADTPAGDLALYARSLDVDLVVVGATLNTQQEALQRTVGWLKGELPELKVLVGGAALGGLEQRAGELGADGCVARAQDAPRAGLDLLQGS